MVRPILNSPEVILFPEIGMTALGMVGFVAVRLRTSTVPTRGMLVALCLMAAISAPSYAQQSARLGISDSPPISFMEENSGSSQGLAVDLIREVGREAGFEPDLQMLPFSSLLPSLAAKQSTS